MNRGRSTLTTTCQKSRLGLASRQNTLISHSEWINSLKIIASTLKTRRSYTTELNFSTFLNNFSSNHAPILTRCQMLKVICASTSQIRKILSSSTRTKSREESDKNLHFGHFEIYSESKRLFLSVIFIFKDFKSQKDWKYFPVINFLFFK